MDMCIYSVESSMQNFFETMTTATRTECDVEAASIVGGSVEPVPMQGMWSYTVTAGLNQACIVQFRAEQSRLDMANMHTAMQVHATLVPKCSYHGQIGGESPLYIYVMDKRDGMSYIQARDISPEGRAEFEIQQFRTVGDLARFFIEAWEMPQHVTPTVANNLYQELKTDLDRLSKELPNRFTGALSCIRERLPRILTLPFVLTHDDLNETNILVDDTGCITAIVDWAEAKVLPFGFSLWALENILGYMDGMGWHYHDNAETLRDEFWRIFEIGIGNMKEEMKEDIRFARMVGLFLRYGFEQDGSARGKVRDSDIALRYADAFCMEDI